MNNRLSDEDMAITKHQMRHVLLCKKLGVKADKDAVRWLLDKWDMEDDAQWRELMLLTSRGRDQGDS
jgi:hypothetical protein